MPSPKLHALVGASALTLALSACGGTGGTGTAYLSPAPVTPTPTPTPPPPKPSDVPAGGITALKIFNDVPTGDLAVAGGSADGFLGDPQMLATASLAPADLPQIRYDGATNTYQVKYPDGVWETLWTTGSSEWTSNAFAGKNNTALIGFNWERDNSTGTDPYPYSTLAWFSGPGQNFGWMAAGVPTPASAVPVSGTASYDGIIAGTTDIFKWEDGGYPSYAALGVVGSVTLSFNFSGGTLSGSMEPMLGSQSLGIYTFKDGVYSAGAYSGQFNTSVSGLNSFYGQLTGPNAEELIGGWALPFHYSGDDHDHEAIGAWIAKKP